MVSYTPNLNLPYVLPADTVTSYPVTSQDLATKLDNAVRGAIYRGVFTKTTDTSGQCTVTNTELGAAAGFNFTGCVASVSYGQSNNYVVLVSARVNASPTSITAVFLKWADPTTNPIAFTRCLSTAVTFYVMGW